MQLLPGEPAHLPGLAGQTLAISATVNNPGFAESADFYLGAVLPDGGNIVFWTGGSDTALGTAAEPRTFRPYAAGVSLATQFSLHMPNLLVHQWTGAEPRGGYVLFNLVTKAGGTGRRRGHPRRNSRRVAAHSSGPQVARRGVT